MPAQLLDGQKIAADLLRDLKSEAAHCTTAGMKPHLVSLAVGPTAGAKAYAARQAQVCSELGVGFEERVLSEVTTERELHAALDSLGRDPKVTGVLLAMPLPHHIDPRRAQSAVPVEKDVEGVHPTNVGRLMVGTQSAAPCTALAVMELLKATGESLRGREVVVINHSEIVGKPLALLLLQSVNASPTVHVCHVATRDTFAHVQRADIVVVAVGKPGFLHGEHIRPGAIVIDVGINRVPVTDAKGIPAKDRQGRVKTHLVGDCAYEEVRESASWITPVPGGVGPVTVAMLMRNLVLCTKGMLEGAGTWKGGR
ncbi:MAG: bifunctional 5,10-methylenetetrahydrofolate dehydrogenase/5,10-methenyltetrahydrofolate cyclohydrolase [Planctomycetes bacterium]|nr:bifunctional 5,10-methylenetetrahydrofolate dehydrogenase/5,10-methenyltetrahydrofolate cyclohydrolase [Planctomycetota bacterium]